MSALLDNPQRTSVVLHMWQTLAWVRQTCIQWFLLQIGYFYAEIPFGTVSRRSGPESYFYAEIPFGAVSRRSGPESNFYAEIPQVQAEPR